MKPLMAVCAAVLLSAVTLAHADSAPVIPLTAPLNVYLSLGPLSFVVPGQAFRLVALYDVVAKAPLAGAETVLATLKVDRSSTDPWDVDFTAGAVTDAKALGAPIFGLNLAKTNPTDQWVTINNLKLGIFGGYNPNSGNGSSKPIMAGVKMDYELRFW